MLVMLCTGATLLKKNFCLVARIVSLDTAGLHLLIFYTKISDCVDKFLSK